MWIMKQPGPGLFERFTTDEPVEADLRPGELLLSFAAGGICGSDIPKFLGAVDPDNPCTGLPGTPLHEFVGYVRASRSEDFAPGDRVVGHVEGSRGLAEYVINPAHLMTRLSSDLSDVEATMVQPLSTVLSSLARIPPVKGKSVAVIGLGPLGLLFTHALKTQGAALVTGVDRVDRSDVASQFGIDVAIKSESRHWAEGVRDEDRPAVVVDAVGHRQEIITDAITALRPGGHVLVFGLPEDHYVIPMRSFFRKELTMSAGANKEWPKYLQMAEGYVEAHRSLPAAYITDALPAVEAQSAYSLYARPAVGRVKVVLTKP